MGDAILNFVENKINSLTENTSKDGWIYCRRETLCSRVGKFINFHQYLYI